MSDPMQDPQKREQVELARNFSFHLLKGIKQIGMYRHNEAKFPAFLEKAHEAIGQYTDAYGALSMKVDPQNFLLYQQPLFSDENALPYRFFKDGIRQIIFRPGLTVDELVKFTLIALSDERSGEDVLNQLWRSALENIEYVVVEGFTMDDVSDEEVEVEVEKIVGYLYNRLRTNSDDYLRFARVSTEDLDSRVESVDQIRGAVIQGVTASDELKARLQREIEEEESQRLFPKLVTAIFQVVETGVDEPEVLEEVFLQLLDAMLLQEDFAAINNIVLKLRAMEQRGEDGGALEALRHSFVSRMGEEQRLGRIGEILRTSRPSYPEDLVRYLRSVEGLAIPVLLDILAGIDIPENRQLLCDVLAEHAIEMPQPFMNRLHSERPQTVRDMVYILEKSAHPDRVKMFGQVLRHRNLAVKLDAMHVIAKGKNAEARRLIVEALSDTMPQVRILAAKLLPEFDRERAYLDLIRTTREPTFERRSHEEKAAFYAALGSTGLPGALSMLTQILAAKPTLLNKKKLHEQKLLAVAGLGGALTIQGFKLLQALVEDRSQPTDVLVAARKAMYQTRRALFGDSAEAP